MKKRQIIIGMIILFALAWPLSGSAASNDAKIDGSKTDIRILIDVSGSMKKNDPNNLRRPALRLLTGLLPNDSKAGIWTFGQFVNMLVPPTIVNQAWKDRARQASREIKSHGLFTNIEDTLLDASWDWKEPNPAQQRSLILLTDGLVDIARDDQLNQDSKRRILNQILPRLQQAGVHIHTIALSSDADENLLSQLSSATQGIHAQVNSAAELERVFLRLFEASAETETLPLQGNTIQVDNSIQEMTLLIFHLPDSPATRIILPDGSSIDQQTQSSHISWHDEQRYDLITIQKPAMGTWTIEADMDPDNRVLVVTDLALHNDRLPTNITTTDQHALNIHLSEGDQPIINKDFLHFIKVTATQYNNRGDQEQLWSLLDNGLRNDATENDGIYTLALDKPFAEGRHELVINVDGTTFSRQQRLHFEVFKDPVITTIETTDMGLSTLYITPINGLINPDKMEIIITVNDETTHREATREHQNEWQLQLNDLDSHQRHRLSIEIKGQRNDDTIHVRLDPLFFGTAPAIETVVEPEPDVATPKNSPPPTEAHSQQPDQTSEDNEDSGEGSSLLIFLLVLVFNGTAAAIGFFLYKKYKKNTSIEHPLNDIPGMETSLPETAPASTAPEEQAHE